MSKIKRRECKSLKEFNKIERKYTRKFFGKSPMRQYNYQTYWYTWIWIDIIGLEALDDSYLTKYASKHANLTRIINTVKHNYNKVSISKSGELYYLQGIEISNEDYYYIYINKSGEKQYDTCVGGI